MYVGPMGRLGDWTMVDEFNQLIGCAESVESCSNRLILERSVSERSCEAFGRASRVPRNSGNRKCGNLAWIVCGGSCVFDIVVYLCFRGIRLNEISAASAPSTR